MFAERGFESVTIADIAAGADVAVQTVFNHFPTKEDLFFEGRADWVDAAAAAVRSRPPHVAPLSALREHLMTTVRSYVGSLAEPGTRSMIATLEASPALTAYERELHHESVRRLSDALLETCPDGAMHGDPSDGGIEPSVDLRISASLTASVWLAAIRALLIEQRTELAHACDTTETATAIERLAAQVLDQFETNPGIIQCCSTLGTQPTQITGWPTGAGRAL